MKAAFVIGLLALRLSDAHAGACVGDEGEDEERQVSALEAFAKNPKQKQRTLDEDVWCIMPAPAPFKRRIEKACTTILDRDPTFENCIHAVAGNGIATLGSHDIVALVVARNESPFDLRGDGITLPQLLAKLGDPRGAAIIVDTWKATIPLAEGKKKGAIGEWRRWRLYAIAALGTLGGATERAFLDEQLAVTKEKSWRKAYSKAIAAIDARTTK
jgi:hypothetical protein